MDHDDIELAQDAHTTAAKLPDMLHRIAIFRGFIRGAQPVEWRGSDALAFRGVLDGYDERLAHIAGRLQTAADELHELGA